MYRENINKKKYFQNIPNKFLKCTFLSQSIEVSVYIFLIISIPSSNDEMVFKLTLINKQILQKITW